MKQEKKAVPVATEKLKGELDIHVTSESKIENLDKVVRPFVVLGFLFLALFSYKVWNERRQTIALENVGTRLDKVADEVHLVAGVQAMHRRYSRASTAIWRS